MPPWQERGEGYSLSFSQPAVRWGSSIYASACLLARRTLPKVHQPQLPSWGLKLFGFLFLVCWSGGSSKPLPRQGHGFSVAVASPAAFPGHHKTGVLASRCCSDCWKKSWFRSRVVAGSMAAHPHTLLELPRFSAWLEAGFFSSPEVCLNLVKLGNKLSIMLPSWVCSRSS